LSGNPSFEELLRQARSVFLAAHSRQWLPVHEAMRRLAITQAPGQTPFHFVLSYLPRSPTDKQARTPQEPPAELIWTPEVFTGNARALGSLGLVIREQAMPAGIALQGNWGYRRTLFEAEYARGLLQRLQGLMAAAAKSPDQPLSRFKTQG